MSAVGLQCSLVIWVVCGHEGRLQCPSASWAECGALHTGAALMFDIFFGTEGQILFGMDETC